MGYILFFQKIGNGDRAYKGVGRYNAIVTTRTLPQQLIFLKTQVLNVLKRQWEGDFSSFHQSCMASHNSHIDFPHDSLVLFPDATSDACNPSTHFISCFQKNEKNRECRGYKTNQHYVNHLTSKKDNLQASLASYLLLKVLFLLGQGMIICK